MKRILSIVLGVLSVIVAVGMLFSAYGGVADPLKGTLPALAALTFPAWLVAGAVMLLTGLFWCRKGAVLMLVAALLCWPALKAFWPVHPGGEERAAGAQFSLMTYNVQGFVNFEAPADATATGATLEYILGSGCDIVALQECWSFSRSNSGEMPRELVDSLYRVYPYRAIGPHMQALLSRYPIEPVDIADRSLRAAAWRVLLPQGDVTVVNVHLRSLGLSDADKAVYKNLTDGARGPVKQELREMRHDVIPKLSAAFRERAEQAAAVRAIVGELRGAVIVCGDFNDVTRCYSCRVIESAGLTDVYTASGNGPAITYHDNRFYFRIDHIFCSDALRAVYARVDRNPTSDHYPLTAFFNFRPAPDLNGYD